MRITVFRYEQPGRIERLFFRGLRYQACLSDDPDSPCVYAATVEGVVAKALRKWGEWPTEHATADTQRFVGEVTVDAIDREASLNRRVVEAMAGRAAA